MFLTQYTKTKETIISTFRNAVIIQWKLGDRKSAIMTGNLVYARVPYVGVGDRLTVTKSLSINEWTCKMKENTNTGVTKGEVVAVAPWDGPRPGKFYRMSVWHDDIDTTFYRIACRFRHLSILSVRPEENANVAAKWLYKLSNIFHHLVRVSIGLISILFWAPLPLQNAKITSLSEAVRTS